MRAKKKPHIPRLHNFNEIGHWQTKRKDLVQIQTKARKSVFYLFYFNLALKIKGKNILTFYDRFLWVPTISKSVFLLSIHLKISEWAEFLLRQERH